MFAAANLANLLMDKFSRLSGGRFASAFILSGFLHRAPFGHDQLPWLVDPSACSQQRPPRRRHEVPGAYLQDSSLQDSSLQDSSRQDSSRQDSSRVPGIKIGRRFFLALRDHFGRIRLSRYSPRAELFSLDVIFGLPWPSVIHLPANLDAFIVYLSAGFPFRSHLRDPLLEKPRRSQASPLGDPRRRLLMPPQDEIVPAGQRFFASSGLRIRRA
jgi:hypothetical protein